MNKYHRVLGALFGVACGDALGATLEFVDKKTGVTRYGYHKEIIGGGIMRLQPGEVTDDTMMTLAVGNGIIKCAENPINNIGDEFLKWYKTHPKEIEVTCEKAIEKYLDMGDWFEAACATDAVFNGKTTSNGSLMRCIPVALCYRDLEKVKEVSRLQSKMTHCSEEAELACEIYNTIIYKYLKGEDKIKVLKEVLAPYNQYNKVFSMMKKELNPSQNVEDSLLTALWCFVYGDDVETVVCEAVNLYGDSDTIGAIAGGLAGVYYGYKNIPKEWLDKILIKNEIINLAEKINGLQD